MQDRSFGPLVSLSVGGPTAALFASPAYRVLPLTDVDATELVGSAPGSALLSGPGPGSPEAIAGLESILLRVAEMACDLPDVAELRLDPVLIGEAGAGVAAASVRLARASYEDPTLRRLSGPGGDSGRDRD